MVSFFGKFLSIIDKWKWRAVDYDGQFWFQCVDWAKEFVFEQYWVRLGNFSWSALQCWNTGSAFDWSWKRVNYKTWLIPNIWDVVFLDKTNANPYGHVCIADNWSDTLKLCVVEENASTGNGDGKWGNSVTQRTISYTSIGRWYCLGWFTRM